MRRTKGRGGGGGKTQHHHLYESWAVKADDNKPHHQPQEQEQQESNIESSSITSISCQQQKSHDTYQNPKWVSRNGPSHSSKHDIVENFELGSPKSGPSLIAEVGSSNRELENKENNDVGLNKSKSKYGKEGYETKDGVDDVECLLEKLRLGVDEPELSEEQLRIMISCKRMR
ncbi:conserved hypothetical protein [Ricinus communis]|uniref:Uncharacterized protein n=1 Tax=Ricinus communis TaxID=3988 RepID=B9SNU0_RICCO|nr:conserved hypothetical protein [Ricinus communis]